MGKISSFEYLPNYVAVFYEKENDEFYFMHTVFAVLHDGEMEFRCSDCEGFFDDESMTSNFVGYFDEEWFSGHKDEIYEEWRSRK